jgi:hypothetical protein
MAFAAGSHRPVMEPFSLAVRETRDIFSPVMGTSQIPWPVEEIDRSDLSEFLGRWIGWFADAASGTLCRPMMLPEKPCEGSWRR